MWNDFLYKVAVPYPLGLHHLQLNSDLPNKFHSFLFLSLCSVPTNLIYSHRSVYQDILSVVKIQQQTRWLQCRVGGVKTGIQL